MEGDYVSISDSIVLFLVDDLLIDFEALQVDRDASMQHVLGVDSLGFVELMAFVEDTFGVSVSKEEFAPENFSSVNALTRFVCGKISSGAT